MDLMEFTPAELEIAQLRHALARGRTQIDTLSQHMDIAVAKQLRRMDELQKQMTRLLKSTEH